jgi:tetratricopeptide (TPR) repeat protein
MNSTSTLALDALQACLDAADGRADDALAKLADRTDPESMRARLTILLDLERFAEAQLLIADKPLHSEWCLKAVVAVLSSGAVAKGVALVQQIDEQFAGDGLLRVRCRLAGAQTLYERAFRETDNENLLFPVSLDAEQRTLIDAAAEALKPVVDRVHSFGRIESPLELHSFELAFQLAFLKADRESSIQIGAVLERFKPLPMAFVAGVLRRQTPYSSDLVLRLRAEHDNSWESKLAAIRLEGYVLERPERAALSALALIGSAPDDYREELGKILFDLTGTLPAETAANIERLLPEVMSSESPILLAVKIREALQAGNLSCAEKLISTMANKEEPIALQFQAHLLLEQGRKPEARAVLQAACRRFPTPALFELAADLAADEADWDAAAAVLAQVLVLVPADAKLRKKRAAALIESAKYVEAAEEFAQLSRLEPETHFHRFNRAAAFAQGGRLDESLAAFESFCEAADTPLEGLLGRVQILTALDRATEAFSLLDQHRERFWDERQFVAVYMSSGYSSGNDAAAHRGMMRLQEIEQRLEPSQRILRAFSLNDLKEHFTHFNKSDDLLQEQLLRGEVPWLFVDQLLNKVPYAAWAARTQSLLWESDDSVVAARFSIYSSNVFHTVSENGIRELCELTCSHKNARVCMDMSSLMTLQELGLLEKAASYFGGIFVPAQCCEASLEHLRRLIPHQPSRRDSAIALRALMESGRLHIMGDDNQQRDGLPRLFEYDDSSDHSYHLIDLATELRRCGAISEVQFQGLSEVAHAASGVDADHPALCPGQELLVNDATLDVLHQRGVLAATMDTFDIFVSSQDRKDVLGRVAAFGAQAELHAKAQALMKAIQSDQRFVVEHVPLPEEFQDEELFGDPMQASTFAAAFGAVSQQLPLFADDRALQMFVHHRRQASESVAFGTGAFLNQLIDEDDADLATLGPAMLSLLQWRYRFVIPPTKLLKYYADQFFEHLPGRFLKSVASYAHQSMRDPGLFCGFEPTTPPSSIGARLYLLWIKAFMDLSSQCWLDEAYSHDQANSLTRWIFSEAIPPPPRRLEPNAQRLLAEQTALSSLNYLALGTVISDDPERIKAALQSLKQGLGLRDDQYLHLVTKIAHGH